MLQSLKQKKGDFFVCSSSTRGFPGGSRVKNPSVSAGEVDLIPGSGRSPGEENADLFQYSCLRNPMDMTEQLSTHTVVTEIIIIIGAYMY